MESPNVSLGKKCCLGLNLNILTCCATPRKGDIKLDYPLIVPEAIRKRADLLEDGSFCDTHYDGVRVSKHNTNQIY